MALAPYCSIHHLKIKGVSSDPERSVGTRFDNCRRIVEKNLKLSKKNEQMKGEGQVLSQEGGARSFLKGMKTRAGLVVYSCYQSRLFLFLLPVERKARCLPDDD